MKEREISNWICADGFLVSVDEALGHLWVVHDGTITWDQLQAIKTEARGDEARAIEVYPADRDMVNHGDIRHLWRLGAVDFCPELLGRTNADGRLEARYARAWAGQ